jgi:hypothetical protein
MCPARIGPGSAWPVPLYLARYVRPARPPADGRGTEPRRGRRTTRPVYALPSVPASALIDRRRVLKINYSLELERACEHDDRQCAAARGRFPRGRSTPRLPHADHRLSGGRERPRPSRNLRFRLRPSRPRPRLNRVR